MDKNFKAVNAPIIDFEPGSKHREELIKEIERQSNRQKAVPVIILEKNILQETLKPVQNLMIISIC